MAAKNCADLIDAIYVQERTDDTDAQCEAAKAAWDALTDTQKEMVVRVRTLTPSTSATRHRRRQLKTTPQRR